VSNDNISREGSSSKGNPNPLLVSELGWTVAEVQETRARLAAWEEDWDAPGMEAYDNL
jgi:hypothetical protein